MWMVLRRARVLPVARQSGYAQVLVAAGWHRRSVWRYMCIGLATDQRLGAEHQVLVLNNVTGGRCWGTA